MQKSVVMQQPTEESQIIDPDGFRENVGIILISRDVRVFWGRRRGQLSWQFPQGGIRPCESPEDAMYRELEEETGLSRECVSILGCTSRWLRYRLPDRFVRRHCRPLCIGQKQIWFMLRMLGSDNDFDLDLSDSPEFDHWRWVDYWYPMQAVVHFKQDVYDRALREFAPLLFPDGHPTARPPQRRRERHRRRSRHQQHKSE